MKEQLEQYVKQVKERHEHCEDNEHQTKQSLIAPLFALLGWDMADPRECKPEYRADFGKGAKYATPVDWAFAIPPAFAFIVEAKECGKKLKTSSAQQLAMYFAQASVNLGIYTNGVQWWFFTDLDKVHIMDKEPFLTWNVLDDEAIPLDFLKIMQKSEFKPQHVKTFAEQGRRQSLLVRELTKLLEPSADFIKLAVKEIETRALHPNVVEEWRPILVNAIQEWAKVRALEVVLDRPTEGAVKQSGIAKNADEAKAIIASLKRATGEKTERHALREKFWTALVHRAKARGTRHGKITPGEYSYLGAGSGVRGLPFNYVIRQTDGAVELYIDRGADTTEENKDIFNRLHKHKDEIEKAFGNALSWEPLDEQRSCRIAYGTAGGYRDDEAKWPAIQDAMIEAMGRLEQAIAPHLAKLKTEGV